MRTEAVHLTAEKETLLPTLYGKALDSRRADSILGDTFADDVVHRLDYDFAKLELPKGASISLPVRAKHLDDWTRELLAKYPLATVLHLGCGLDSRVCRIDPPPTVRWYDVDHPEVIELRRRLYPARPGYAMIGSALSDLGWLVEIPADRPVIVVAEGVLIYLRQADGIALLRAITGRFPSRHIMFDAYSRAMLWLTARLPAVKRTGALLSWGIDDAHQIEAEVPRLRLTDEVPFLTLPELVSRLSQSGLQQLVFGLMSRSAFVKKLVRHLRYQF